MAEPGELAVIGRVEAGEGVLVLRDGEPVELARLAALREQA